VPGALLLPVEAPAETVVWRVSPYGARTAGLPVAVSSACGAQAAGLPAVGVSAFAAQAAGLPAVGVSPDVARPYGILLAMVTLGVAPQACEWESAPAISARVASCQGTRHASGALTCRERPTAAVVPEAPVGRLAVSDVP
jgi:hypothetical protein